MSSSVVPGQFLWHELLTSDPEAGAGFYSQVLGWAAHPADDDSGYTMLAGKQGPVAGARVLGKDPLAQTLGPNWLTYVGVPDLPAALAAVETHKGRVIHPVTTIPDGGRYAVIADPQGGVIGIFEPPANMPAGNRPTGTFAWHELTADDVEAALEFYKAIFGWEIVAQFPMGGEVGTYYIFGHGTTQLGGAFRRGKQLPQNWPHWLLYISVPGIMAAVSAATKAGGGLLNGPHKVPGDSWVAQVVDSHGVPIALSGANEAESKPKAKPPKATTTQAASAVKPRAKAKTKTKPKTRSKAKAKAKTKAKTKVRAKSKVKAKVKAAAKKKPVPKTKAKAKGNSRPKTKAANRRKSARRGK